MEKIDFKKELKNLYSPSNKEFALITVPEMQFLMIDGMGNPNTSQDYTDAIQALFGVAYKIKFKSKNDLNRDYIVPPLEGLWWADDMNAFAEGNKDAWQWTVMIMQPDWINLDIVNKAKRTVEKKELPALSKMRFEKFREGLSVQVLHIGSYQDEGTILKKMHEDWIPKNSYEENGKHHEIYLNDPRKVEAAKLKTVLRQPIRKL